MPRGLKVGGNLSLSRCYHRVTNAETRRFVDYVLGDFSKSEIIQITDVLNDCKKHFENFILRYSKEKSDSK